MFFHSPFAMSKVTTAPTMSSTLSNDRIRLEYSKLIASLSNAVITGSRPTKECFL